MSWAIRIRLALDNSKPGSPKVVSRLSSWIACILATKFSNSLFWRLPGVLPPPGQVDVLQARLAQQRKMKNSNESEDDSDDDDAGRDKAGRKRIVQSVRGGQVRRNRQDDDDDDWA